MLSELLETAKYFFSHVWVALFVLGIVVGALGHHEATFWIWLAIPIWVLVVIVAAWWWS